MNAATIYLEEFRRRGEKANAQRFGRQELLTEAAHDAYQAAADRLTQQHGWDDERALVVMRGLNLTVQRWLDSGGGDWDALDRALQQQESQIQPGGQRSGPTGQTGAGPGAEP
jgi:hypothetical protein